ncbi:hypothetical protein EB118_07665 [bacterium]|jgi:uncharacterized protein with PQ loop repeat|nr:hypothetical protein [bacterium]NBX97644.1 hypothetical protein [bacterium]NDC94581.1 hypothetical protein [bacterium]NDD84161.1 hypothetical protein [bacterium]NDG29954.1 hypothetical protein [bacterium]
MRVQLDKTAYKFLKKEQTSIDRMMMLVGSLTPLATIPQIITIYSAQSVANVSLLTWILYDLSSVLFLSYAILHKLPPLIISSILWIIVDSAVVIAWFIFH